MTKTVNGLGWAVILRIDAENAHAIPDTAECADGVMSQPWALGRWARGRAVDGVQAASSLASAAEGRVMCQALATDGWIAM